MTSINEPCGVVSPHATVSRVEGALVPLAVALATLSFLAAVAQPIEWLLHIVPDDSFYYFKIGLNIAAQGDSSFDGLTKTNGYHPGWMFVVVVLASAFDGGEALVRAALGAAFAFHLLSAAFIARLLSVFGTAAVARVGAALWLVNPTPLTLALQGTEAALYMCGLAFTMYRFAVLATQRERVLANAAWLGAGLAWCFLGRTEASILAGFVSLAALVLLPSGRRFNGALIIGAVFTLCVCPWFVYSKLATGAFFQHSGAMKMLWAEALPRGFGERVFDGFVYLFGGFASYPLLGLPGGALLPRVVLNGVMTIFVLGYLGVRLRDERTRAAAAVGLSCTLATLATGLVYGFLFVDTQFWYKAQSTLLLFVVTFSVVVDCLKRYFARFRFDVGIVGGVAVAAFAALLGLRLVTFKPYPWQVEVYQSQPALEARVPTDQLIGCFNAGIPAFFSERRIVNLDGLVNNAVFPYYRTHTFERYLYDHSVRYLIDEREALERALHFASVRPALEIIATEPLPSWPSADRVLWHVADTR